MIQIDAAITTGVFTLLGVGLMALQQHRTNKLNLDRQDKLETNKLKASLVTAERIRWLQDLRARVSAYYADAEELTNLLTTPTMPLDDRSKKNEMGRLHRDLKIAANNITLMLSPLDPDQNVLIFYIESTRRHIDSYMSANALEPRIEDIVKDRENGFVALTKVGAEAWRQVQALE